MTKIAGSSVDEFIKNANQKFGGNLLGETEHHAAFKYGSFKDGKIVKLEFSCPIDLDYAEVGSGKPDPPNKKAIAEVAALAKEHESNHKKYYDKAYTSWNSKKIAKELMGKKFDTKSRAEDAIQEKFDELVKALLGACLDLHKKEGIIQVDPQKDGSFKVTKKAAGASGCS